VKALTPAPVKSAATGAIAALAAYYAAVAITAKPPQ
jgi:hypothetical protein